jgi:hypothetical protein
VVDTAINPCYSNNMKKHYILAKPDRPNWQPAVERAAKLLRENPDVRLSNHCQNVPMKWLKQLWTEANEANKAAAKM